MTETRSDVCNPSTLLPWILCGFCIFFGVLVFGSALLGEESPTHIPENAADIKAIGIVFFMIGSFLGGLAIGQKNPKRS